MINVGVANNSDSDIIDSRYEVRETVAAAMEESLADNALGRIANRFIDESGNVDLNGFIDRVIEQYESKGHLGVYRQFFSDGGARVITAIENARTTNGGEVKFALLKGNVFPPYNESRSDANEKATRWAHNEDVENGARRIIGYHGQLFLIEKYESLDLGYQVVRKLNKSEYSDWKDQIYEEDIYHGSYAGFTVFGKGKHKAGAEVCTLQQRPAEAA